MLLDAIKRLFVSDHRPRCSGRGSQALAERRALLDDKYTARPLDVFHNCHVKQEELARARKEADVIELDFRRYKREAKCLGFGDAEYGGRRLKKCANCRRWTCNACRYHNSFRIVSTAPLLFADEIPTDLSFLNNTIHLQRLQARLHENEHPYDHELSLIFAHRWTGYCNACFPRITAANVKQICGVFEPCKCKKRDLAKKLAEKWKCLEC